MVFEKGKHLGSSILSAPHSKLPVLINVVAQLRGSVQKTSQIFILYLLIISEPVYLRYGGWIQSKNTGD